MGIQRCVEPGGPGLGPWGQEQKAVDGEGYLVTKHYREKRSNGNRHQCGKTQYIPDIPAVTQRQTHVLVLKSSPNGRIVRMQ